jgi:hypothetical protein
MKLYGGDKGMADTYKGATVIVREPLSRYALLNFKAGDPFRLLDYPQTVWTIVDNYGAVYNNEEHKPKNREGYALCVCVIDGRTVKEGTSKGYPTGFLRWVSLKETVEALQMVDHPEYMIKIPGCSEPI